MIARIWRGAVRAEDGSAYAEYVRRTGIEGYKGTAGNRGAWLLWRVEGDRAEFVTVSLRVPGSDRGLRGPSNAKAHPSAAGA
jgi:hypothetical protein